MKDSEGYEMGNFIATVICDGCEAEIEAVVKGKDFWDGKVGRIRCSNCGAVSLPCNECCGSRIENCGNCPFETAEIIDSLKDRSKRYKVLVNDIVHGAVVVWALNESDARKKAIEKIEQEGFDCDTDCWIMSDEYVAVNVEEV